MSALYGAFVSAHFPGEEKEGGEEGRKDEGNLSLFAASDKVPQEWRLLSLLWVTS